MNKYISTTEAGKKLGISRIAVFNRIKNGKLEAIKIGRNYAIPSSALLKTEPTINKKTEQEITKAVQKTVKEYGETLKLLAKE
ncbi:helix-turn-helix domain-containing protein [Patescibacteria group bacterium]|nr:helix-turn-helix domain-containing protein [Patescibacteria group bacterium]